MSVFGFLIEVAFFFPFLGQFIKVLLALAELEYLLQGRIFEHKSVLFDSRFYVHPCDVCRVDTVSRHASNL